MVSRLQYVENTIKFSLMRLFQNVIGTTACSTMLALAVCLPAAASHVHRQPTAGHTKHHHHSSKKSHKLHGQRAIDPERATEIQQALIKDHYLNGTATGTWDAESQSAMQKFQADNGWQTKITPDSRALIKLGLGPKQDDGEYATAATRSPVIPTTDSSASSSGMTNPADSLVTPAAQN